LSALTLRRGEKFPGLIGLEEKQVFAKHRYFTLVIYFEARKEELKTVMGGGDGYDRGFADKIRGLSHPNIQFGIPLMGDIESLHDGLTGVTGSFRETVAGLRNLALTGQRVEIRVVIVRENYPRLPETAEFIYRNLPFAAHIAFMGLEMTGAAARNSDCVRVEPALYADALLDAVRHLHRRAMAVSIYNLPLCLLPSQLRPFARDSISEWKKGFPEMCRTCRRQPDCPGFFMTSESMPSEVTPL
jgi:His-Xaa-Ser system radical SAM maturase HxsC